MLLTTTALVMRRNNAATRGASQRSSLQDDAPPQSSYSRAPASPPSSSSSRVSFRRVSQLRLLQRRVGSIRLMNALDGAQSVLALLSALLWMVQAYPPYSGYQNILWIQFIVTVVYIVDLLLRVALCGSGYLLTRWAVFDVVTCLPIFWLMYLLGFYHDSSGGSEATSGFVTFLVALQQVWSLLILARFVRVFKLLRLTELRSLTFLFPNALTRTVASLLLTILAIIALGAGLMFLIENAWSYGEQQTYQQWLYFMVVTISTVGYGDITPKTVLGQVAVMGIILFAIVVVPLQTSEFLSALQDHYKRGLPYRRRSPHVVLVLPATLSTADLDVVLEEFFNSTATLLQYDVVILSNGGEEHREALLSHVRSTQYWSQVSYILGTPSSVQDLGKAAVERAQAVFLLPSTHLDGAKAEQAADEQSLMRAISIKHYWSAGTPSPPSHHSFSAMALCLTPDRLHRGLLHLCSLSARMYRSSSSSTRLVTAATCCGRSWPSSPTCARCA